MREYALYTLDVDGKYRPTRYDGCLAYALQCQQYLEYVVGVSAYLVRVD